MAVDQKDADALLAQEYLTLQRFIEDFDGRSISIKTWSVTSSIAGLAAAYVQGSPTILWLAAASAFVFWIVEAMWKTNQQAYYPRIDEIERHFHDGQPTAPLRIARSWTRSFFDRGRYLYALRIMVWPHVALPHCAVVIGAALLGVLNAPGTGR